MPQFSFSKPSAPERTDLGCRRTPCLKKSNPAGHPASEDDELCRACRGNTAVLCVMYLWRAIVAARHSRGSQNVLTFSRGTHQPVAKSLQGNQSRSGAAEHPQGSDHLKKPQRSVSRSLLLLPSRGRRRRKVAHHFLARLWRQFSFLRLGHEVGLSRPDRAVPFMGLPVGSRPALRPPRSN